MKSYIKLVSLGLALAGLSSCTDLDTPIKAQYTGLPDNPIAVEGELNSCYYYLHSWFGRDFNEGVVNQGDEIMGVCYGLGNYYDDGRSINGSIHSLTLNNWNTRMIGDMMAGSNQCSKIIGQYGGPDRNDPVISPVRAARAYYHFWMMDLYGDCPILEVVQEEGQPVDRRPRKEVAEWIAKELEEILAQTDEDGNPALSKANDASTYGKPNYWMAAALLAKLYLNWGVYTHDIYTVDNNTPNEKLNDCVKWCDVLINSGVFEVGTGYRVKFLPTNGVHIKDFIYAYDVDPSTKPNGTTTWYRWFGFKKEGLLKPGTFTWTVSKSTGGNHVVTPEAIARFNLPGDERNQIILNGPQYQMDAQWNITETPIYLYKDPTKENTLIGQLNFRGDFEFDDGSIYSLGDESLPAVSKATVADGTAFLNIQKGARCCKYPPRQEDYDLWNRQQANDYPIFRLADILMMKAECIMRGATATNGATIESLINPIRLCSGAPTISGNFSMQDLLDERSRELFMECWRRNDLIRFGQFENDWAQKNRYKVWDDEAHTQFHWVEREGANSPQRRLMPIHKDILETNTNWSQNPGYQGI